MIKLLCHTITKYIYALLYCVNVIMQKERKAHVCVFTLITQHAIWIYRMPYSTLWAVFVVFHKWQGIIISASTFSCKVAVILYNFNQTWVWLTYFCKVNNTKFHKYLSSDKQALPCPHRNRHVAKLILAVHYCFTNAPKNRELHRSV
jgi:hypothetical protein